MRRRIWLCTLFAVLPLSGCTEPNIMEPAYPHKSSISLVAFDSCAQLAKQMQDAAAKNVQRAPLPVPEGARAAVPAPTTPAFSGTNVHEIGADEPDIVKTDGRRIVTVQDGVLRVIDPVTRAQTGRLDLGGTGSELLLSGNRALVLITALDRRIATPVPNHGPLLMPAGQSDLVLVDLSGPPTVISRYHGDGRVVDARQTGNVVRIVVAQSPALDYPPRTTSADTWLPKWEITTGSTTAKGGVRCEDVLHPAAYSGASLLTVLTLNLFAPTMTFDQPVTVVSDGDTVYGTGSSLYIANDQGWRGSATTEIFKFALPESGAKPMLEATGQVPGDLLNQYALSEWDHHLRVATTSGSASAVRVLESSNGRLVQVGEVGGLGRDEQIYSVRFIGPRGYVVTFRQIDPLYSLDLSDAAHPKVTGELKISGYSAHLQPVGDNRLIGIGQEATTDGLRQGLQISLFDTTDPAAPRRLAQQVLPGSRSEAEFDPHALLWWPDTRLLVVPVLGQGALALRVGDTTLQTAKRLDGATVRRALVIGNELWTLTDTSLTAANLSNLDQEGRVTFS